MKLFATQRSIYPKIIADHQPKAESIDTIKEFYKTEWANKVAILLVTAQILFPLLVLSVLLFFGLTKSSVKLHILADGVSDIQITGTLIPAEIEMSISGYDLSKIKIGRSKSPANIQFSVGTDDRNI